MFNRDYFYRKNKHDYKFRMITFLGGYMKLLSRTTMYKYYLGINSMKLNVKTVYFQISKEVV